MAEKSKNRLQNEVRQLLTKNGYSFSEKDKALLEEILLELDKLPEIDNSGQKNEILLKYLSLLFKYLQFFGIKNLEDLFDNF